jgi:hypothetical protein
MESIEKLGERLEAVEQCARMMERRLRRWRILACGLVVVGLVILPLVGGTAQEQSSYERAWARRLAAIEYKLQYVTGGANEVVITGANLRIVNGLGDTETTNGLGNLIVGYNELRFLSGDPNERTGSHNVVVGSENNFSSFGGLVVGNHSMISGQFASVSGGFNTGPAGISPRPAGGPRTPPAGISLLSAEESGTGPAESLPRSAEESRTLPAAGRVLLSAEETQI